MVPLTNGLWRKKYESPLSLAGEGQGEGGRDGKAPSPRLSQQRERGRAALLLESNQLARPILRGVVLVALTVAGCPASPAPTPPVAPAVVDLLPPPDVAAPVEPPPRSLELGVLRQALPRLPAPGSVYAVAEFPQHTPPLQDGTEDDRRLVETYCVGCHSTTYISMQPPLSHERWEAEVKKMISAYGAVMPEPIAVRIATYLHSYYGDSPLPPRKRLPAAVADGFKPSGLDP